MTTKLSNCQVEFNPDNHTYQYKGKQLNGVTPIVSWMFPSTYDGVSEAVMQAAAERGSLIHEAIQLTDGIGVDSDLPEVNAYKDILKQYGLKPLANEYLVSDKSAIASSIDVVFDDLSLADIKTTSSIHEDNVTLQLSIYAWLFEKQNPRKKVKDLYVIWLPKAQYGQPKLMKLNRLPSSDISDLITAYLKGESNEPFKKLFPESYPQTTELSIQEQVALTNMEKAIIALEKKKKAIEEKHNEIKSTLIEMMKAHGVKKFDTGRISFSYTPAVMGNRFDTTGFKKECPELYKRYTVQSMRAETLRITIKKQ